MTMRLIVLFAVSIFLSCASSREFEYYRDQQSIDAKETQAYLEGFAQDIRDIKSQLKALNDRAYKKPILEDKCDSILYENSLWIMEQKIHLWMAEMDSFAAKTHREFK
jgi:hypothetical protein